MKVLLTGGSGFIGAAIARALRSRGAQVRAMVRAASDSSDLVALGCELVQGDLRDAASLATAVQGCDAMIHTAADYRLWVPDPAEMLRTNVDGTVALIEAAMAAGVSRIVYTSSVATLGLKDDGTSSDETSAATLNAMVGVYKKSKFLAEQAVRSLIAERGAPVTIVSPTAPFGPWDRKPTPTGRIVVEAASGRMPAYVDTGLNVVHVDDVAAGHLLALDKGVIGESYILGGENHTLRWIIEQVTALAGRSPPLLRLPHWLVLPIAAMSEGMARAGVVREPIATIDELRMARHLMYFSSEKASRELGYRFRPAIVALRDALDWFVAHGYVRLPHHRSAA